MCTFLFRLRVALLLGVLTVLPLSPTQAQTVTLRGLVTATDNGAALVGANVVVTTLDGARAGAAATNVDGLYEVRGLDPGPYRIQISYIGYDTHRDTLHLTGDRRNYSVQLAPAEQQLEEVRVEAERGATRRQAGRQTVGAADLGRVPTPGPSGDLAAYLQTLPGIVSVGDRGGGLYIRGGTPSQTLTLVDGLRVIRPFHISSLYSAFPESLVKSADVYAGGFGAEYMGAISSVLDVHLRRGNLNTFEAGASLSPFLTSARLEGPITPGRSSILALARYSVIDETASSLYGREVPLDFYDLTARYSMKLPSGTSCHLTGMGTHDQGQLNADRNLVLSWTNLAIGGRCLFFGESLEYPIEISAGHTYFDNEAGTASAPQRSASLRKSYIDVSTEEDLFGNTFTYGGRWVLTQYGYDLDEQFLFARQSSQSTGALQAHASMEWRVGERFRIRPSIGTHVTVRRIRSPTFEPRIRFSYRPDSTDDREFSVAAGIYNQVANGITDERDAGTVFTAWRPLEGSDPLAQAIHGILGYRHQLGSALELSIEAYAKRLSNIPVAEWSPVARFVTETALADGNAYGFDVRAELDMNSVYVFLGYGWSSLKYEASRHSLGAWDGGRVLEYHPAHDRRHQLSTVASVDVRDFTINATWKLASGRPYTKVSQFDFVLDLEEDYPTRDSGDPYVFYERPYNARLPSYHRLDVSLERSFDLTKQVSLESKAGVINTYNRSNVFYYDINTLERVDQSPFLPYLSLQVSLE